MPGGVLGTEDVAVNKRSPNSCPHGADDPPGNRGGDKAQKQGVQGAGGLAHYREKYSWEGSGGVRKWEEQF